VREKLKNINMRRIGLAAIDFITVILSCILALMIINEFDIFEVSVISYAAKILIYTFITLACLVVFRVYSNIWKYAQVKDFARCFLGVTCGYALTIIIFAVYRKITGVSYSRIFFTLSFFISAFGIIALRTGYSWLYGFYVRNAKNMLNKKRTLIVGAGNASKRIIGEMFESECEYNPVCIVDDDIKKKNGFIWNVKVEGTIDDIPKICKEKNIEIILVAIPSCDAEEKKRIIELASQTECKIKSLPYIHDIIDMDKLVNQAHVINIEELLGREVVRFDNENIEKLIRGRVCMVTGGGGSIGSELCRQISKYNPRQLIIVDIYENNAYDIQQELIREHGGKLKLNVEIASVRDYQKMDLLFNEYHPQLVFHAAAHKHVPLMETNPEEAVKNNIIGTYNVSTLSDLYKAEKFILISTDKAVNPTNVMGATKRCCEMIVQDMAQNSKATQFITVRFGNVLGSNGSVIPLFEKQIKQGGPVTVTHPDIIRFFMTIPEAVSLILQAAAQANGGEIFVLDMGEPVKILTLAENLIKQHGKRPYKDIKIEFVGLRPGEKLYEELLMDEEGLKSTENKKIFIGKQIEVDEAALLDNLELIRRLANANDKDSVIALLKKMVPTFNHKINN
jgi:FlaA1/EpsC-like NDP-sugar epimerase